MTTISSFISEKFENIKNVITASYEKNAENEDPHAYRLLQEHLERKNAGRIVVFSVITLIAGILEIVFGEKSTTGIIGSVVLIVASVVFCWLCSRIVIAGSTDKSMMKIFIYLYWLSFTVGVLMISAAEQIAGKFPYSFLIYLAAVISVPVAKIYESAVFGAVILIYMSIYGASTGKDIMFYIAVILVTGSYMWISSIVRCCYANIWLGERQLEMTEERCLQISHKDSLTGLLNKSGLSAKFSEVIASGRTGTICVVLIDIDNFRAYNHLYGYDKSDSCLYQVCNCIKIVAKQYTQLVSRFGGDDFVLIFENMNEIEVVKLAEQLRQSIETMAQPFGNGIVTVSVGVSGAAPLKNKDTYSDLLNEADTQLVIAKRSGKNCIGFKGRPFINEGRKPASGM